jgi:hypothetical protein
VGVDITGNMNKNENREPMEWQSLPTSPEGRLVYQLNSAPSESLVIHCADPRFQIAFRRFITEELSLENYTPIVIGGGIHALSSEESMPKNFKILWEQIKFFIKLGGIRRVIFINHEDCRWYEKMHGHLPRINLPDKGKEDLKLAATLLLRDFSGISLETYFAHLVGDEVTFERIS